MFYYQNSPVTVWSVKEERVIYYQIMAQSSKKRKQRSLEEVTLKGTASEASVTSMEAMATSVEAMAATKVEAETGIHDMAQSLRKKRRSLKEAMASEASMTSAESTKAVKAAETGILVHNVDRPRGLAVDWIHLNLYFIDGLRTSIFIVKMKTTETGMYRLSQKTCFLWLLENLESTHNAHYKTMPWLEISIDGCRIWLFVGKIW